ncbi:hypothetical protein J2800_002511 [Caulobacter rhizosphaerae]|uniref:Uncharacterized protein n=1 Tax=Caulobacter rhizosphaerae TaxID=2010972 RepID=A0ABU1N009_9CAUL|nr:hypothetical protein [Caulobacter rhizosphaerae]
MNPGAKSHGRPCGSRLEKQAPRRRCGLGAQVPGEPRRQGTATGRKAVETHERPMARRPQVASRLGAVLSALAISKACDALARLLRSAAFNRAGRSPGPGSG